jgi:hypothetical protein
MNNAEYVVTKRSKALMEGMLNGICADGQIFKGFENSIKPLRAISLPLHEAASLADSLADKAKEESLDVARALLIQLPTHEAKPR